MSFNCNRQEKVARYPNYVCEEETASWHRLNTLVGLKVAQRIKDNPRYCPESNPKAELPDYLCNPASARWVKQEKRVGKIVQKYYGPGPRQPKKAVATPVEAITKTSRKPRVKVPILPPGYTLVKRLGHGVTGNLYLAQPETGGNQVLIKRYTDPVDPETEDQMVQHMEQLKAIQSGFLLRYMDSYYHQPTKTFYLIMTAFDGMTLLDIEPEELTTKQQLDLIQDMILGIQSLHVGHNLTHGNLTPPNVLISPDMAQVKTIDYGLAVDVESWKHNYDLSGGAPYYRPPENIVVSTAVSMDSLPKLRKASDVWTLAGVIYFMLTGHHPFKSPQERSIGDINSNILKGEIDYDLLPDAYLDSPSFMKMLEGMFNKDFIKRLNIEAVMDLFMKANQEITG